MAHVIYAKTKFLIRRYSSLPLIRKLALILAMKFFKPMPPKKVAPPVAKRLKSGRKVYQEGNHYILTAGGVFCS